MSVQEPWVMAVHADTVGADERDLIARSVEDAIAGDRAIMLSTCHRVELYGLGTMPDLDARLKAETGELAVLHLMRVASGLESAIIGEDEVLHQVRSALGNARAARSVDPRLQRLFETAIAAGRRARAGRTASSANLAQRAVAWLQQRSTLAGRGVLIVGAGRMGSSLAHSARLAGADVTIASRNPARAQRLAHVYGGRGIDLASGAELAPKSAGIAVALAGVWHEFQPAEGDLPPIADISAPSAVPAAVRTRLNGGFLGIDDLYVRTQPAPRGYIEEADRVVAAKTREFVRWLDGGRS
ncbi:MAG: NAD(P)-binding domain-containing protein [Candidatus Dormibacteraeota bacterium]|nr:NAD(P)-binding domain-containing protein [Candidatus Dormibacteraeota bacterium]